MSEMVARLDDYGRPAWIAVMVLGFVLFWPVGLAILAYMLWSGRMGCSGHRRNHWQSRFSDKFDKARSRVEDEVRNFSGGFSGGSGPAYSSGNAAFDEYRQATLKRLEEEEREFRSFLDRLRQAKDKSEFDQFMSERREPSAPPAQSPDVPPAA